MRVGSLATWNFFTGWNAWSNPLTNWPCTASASSDWERSLSGDLKATSASTELQRIVQHALARLTPEQRQAIEIAYYSGLSHSEIAAKLGQPLGTVKARIRTGMMLLREHLRPLLAEAQM